MTSIGYDDIQTVRDYFKCIPDKGDNMVVNLLGWTKRGYGAYPTQLPAHRKLRARGLRKLAEFAEENKIRLLLQDNLRMPMERIRVFPRYDVVHSRQMLQ